MPAETLVEQYRDQMLKLLPPGSAMSRRLDSCLTEWSIAFAIEFARLHEAVDTLYQESFPGDATATADTGMLGDWETLCGLPDNCTRLLTQVADRQAAVMSRFAVDQGQSRADFQLIASNFGYSLDVSTYTTSRCGVMRCGHTPLHADPWLFASRMSYEATSKNDDIGTYAYRTGITGADQEIRFNHVSDPSLITTCWLGESDQGATSRGATIEDLAIGEWIRFTKDDDEYIEVRLTGTPTDNTTFYIITVDSGRASSGFTFPPDDTNGNVTLWSSSDADDALECNLDAHKHIHTHINWNSWNSAPVKLLTNLRHHFVAGEYVTHADGDDTIIDSWTNRESGDDITNGARADSVSARVVTVDGWSAADVGEDIASIRGLEALSIKVTADSATLLKHDDFQFFIVVHANTLSAADELLGSTSLSLYLQETGGTKSFRLSYGSGLAIAAAGEGAVYVISGACNGSVNYLQVNGGAVGSQGMTISGSTEALTLGDAFEGSVMEIIASDFTGIPGSDTTVDNVTDYLIAKYL